MSNLFRSEWYKLTRNRSLWLLCIVLFAAAVVNALFVYYDNSNDGGAMSASSGIELWMSSLSANQYIIKIGLSILAGFFISSEYANGTIKRAVTSGFSRSKVIVAKLTAYMLGAMIVALIFPAVNVVLGSALLGFGSLPDASNAEYVVRTFGMTLLVAAAYASITGFFAILLNDSGKTVGFSIVFYFFIDGIIIMASKYIPALKTVYEYSVLQVVLDYANETLSSSKLWTGIIVSAATWAVFLLLGIAAFRRKEIK
ncbi:ABC transporter permease [Cohnella thailandensis]|uniref:ABC transporter permease n=1 Tax=Cohnella thailandensis TaxID=557557 RepID=A0A841T209_9BACL|nr:ABC transporter permease [Cohnella thailandensis]MBP1973234.1 ABC-2 type transport system permease protein [Cohnella thailandensis]